MGKRTTYVLTLQQKPESDWTPYLLAESGLPGPRGNLELAQAAADAGCLEQFNAWLEWTPDRAPVNTQQEFLSFCGAVGLGRLLADTCRCGRPEGGDASAGVRENERLELLERLRRLAADPRWRMREAVAMALQRLGARDMHALLEAATSWAEGRPYEMRAAAAGLCEPALLGEEPHALRVLEILERITTRLEVLARSPRRRGDGAAPGAWLLLERGSGGVPNSGKAAHRALVCQPGQRRALGGAREFEQEPPRAPRPGLGGDDAQAAIENWSMMGKLLN